MKKVLYVTNIEVPYKVKFFNELARVSELTVVYERRVSSNRDSEWAKSEENHFNKIYLEGIRIGNENAFSLSLISIINAGYDEIVISCINSPIQLLAIIYMNIKRIKYVISLDGEVYIDLPGLKSSIKKWFLSGAENYLAAGEKSAEKLGKNVNSKSIYPYYFSSFDDNELMEHRSAKMEREKYVLVVGQYFDYKGLDLAVRLARRDPEIKYKFVGMGKRTDMFIKNEHIEDNSNIEVIPFLKKEALNREYQKAALLLLPSRQECWGLVVNEAASFGTPIVSTLGSGAAVEFLSDYLGEYLFDKDDESGMLEAIRKLVFVGDEDFSAYLKEKSSHYSIEKMVMTHKKVLDL